MAMIYDHAVKYKGKYYPPNTPIVDKEIKVETETEKQVKQPARAKRVKGDTK